MSKNLRPYQHEVICKVEDALKSGVNSQLVVMATGLGKTFTAVKIVEKLQFKRILWVTHNEELISQSGLAFLKDKFDDTFAKHVEAIGFLDWVDKHNCNFGNHTGTFKMGAIKASVFKIDAEVTMASAQTLYRRLDKIPFDYFDCIVVDECFPKGTLVDSIPIEDIKIGDIVTSFNHDTHKTEKKKVVRLFKKEVESDLYKITLENGVEFICTEEHPIYTKEFGYIKAKSIRVNQMSCLYLQNENTEISKRNKNKLFSLFKGNYFTKSFKHKSVYSISKSLLFLKMQGGKMEINDENLCGSMQSMWKRIIFYIKKRKGFLLQGKYILQNIRKLKSRHLLEDKKKSGYGYFEKKPRPQLIINKNEREQSYVDAWSKRKNDKINAGENFFISWRKWRANKTSNNASFINWLRYGIRYTHNFSKRNVSKFTNLLQSRFSGTRTETCNRSGWKDSQVKEVEVFRQEKNRDFKFVGVASCEIYKRRDRSERGEGYEKTYVYNIEVEDNHNYFVENTLVHNCHLFMAKTFVQPLEYFKPKLLLGLTATPTRMDGLSLSNIFDQITYEYNIGQGIKDGYLCELDGIRVQTNVSLDNVRTTAGELNQKDLADEVNIPRRNQLIVNKYKEYADGRQGIFFCVDIQHACDLADMFVENGISCKPIVGDEEFTPDRVGAIQDFKDRKIQVLTNCQILTTGFDEPNVGVIGNASPTKSLTKYMQCLGRGSRLKDKDFVDKFGQNCIILDFVDSSSRHKLVNTWTLDQGKKLEDKLFLTQEKRDHILEEKAKKSAKVENLIDTDERIVLIQLPQAKSFGWKKMQEPATEAQLKYISDLGHDIVNNTYTKQQCADIIALEPCSKKETEYLRSKGYDTIFATKGQYSTVFYELEMKNKWKKR